jgi:hypothetical protein
MLLYKAVVQVVSRCASSDNSSGSSSSAVSRELSLYGVVMLLAFVMCSLVTAHHCSISFYAYYACDKRVVPCISLLTLLILCVFIMMQTNTGYNAADSWTDDSSARADCQEVFDRLCCV